MSAEAKRGYGFTLALLMLGAMTLCLGPHWLSVSIPAALLVWYAAHPLPSSGRN